MTKSEIPYTPDVEEFAPLYIVMEKCKASDTIRL